MEPSPHPALVILGPTGSGKSQLAIEVASQFGGEIVNCDSVQIYRGFVIGAAKATHEEQQGIPHHLLDIAGPEDEFTAGDYSREARKVLVEISGRGKLPVVVGGTGFYLKALLHGLSPAPLRDASLRERLRRVQLRRPAALHRLLNAIDPAAAARIHANDHQKLIRALEIAFRARARVTDVQSAPRDELRGFRTLKMGLSPARALLHDAVNQRAAAMFELGLIEETRALLAAGYTAESKPMQSLGYRQALQYISGSLKLSEAIEQCQAKTRQYVKRQMTWFRKEQNVCWIHGFGADAHVQAHAFSLVRHFLLSTSENAVFIREQR